MSIAEAPSTGQKRSYRIPVKRQPYIEGDVCLVPLTRGHVAVIDAADYEVVAGYNWYATSRPETHVYAERKGRAGTGRYRIRLHNEIIKPDVGLVTDHIDGDTLNNRRGNLRVVTQTDNNRNHSRSQLNTSGATGVSFHKPSRKWQANITVDRRQLYLGKHDTFLAAVKVRADAETKYFGDFARKQA